MGRGAARLDSDVDLIVLSDQPSALLEDRAWTATFGTVTRTQVEDWGNLTSVRVWYDDGLEVEFGVCGVDWAVAEGTDEVLRDGFKVLLDRDGSSNGRETGASVKPSADVPFLPQGRHRSPGAE